MAIHKIFSSLVALTIIGNGLAIPTYTDIKTETLVLHDRTNSDLLNKRIQEVIIGYRRVHPDEAELYKKAGNTLTPSDGRGGLQLGQGVYTSDELGSWEGGKDQPSKSAFNRNCVILANAEAFDKISKAWIPRPDWWTTPLKPRPENYLKGLSLNPAKTIRMAVVDLVGKETLQMMIPNDLLNSKGGGLDIVVNCEDPEKQLELPTHKVDYSKWANVVGEKYAPAETELLKIKEPAEQLVKDSEAAAAEAERAASVQDVEAASAKASAALKSMQDIAQQTVEYTIKNNDWLFIENNLDTFRQYNTARASLKSAELAADEKVAEDYKTKFDAAVKEAPSANNVYTEAEKIVAKIDEVADKVQKDLEALKALKANPDSAPPLELGKLDVRDKLKLKQLEATLLESQISATQKSLTKVAATQTQVKAQLAKLKGEPEADAGDKEPEDKDKEDPAKDKEDPAKDKEDPAKDKEDPAKDKEDPTKDKEDPTKDKEDPTKDKEDPTKDKEDPSKDTNQADSSSNPNAPGKDTEQTDSSSTNVPSGEDGAKAIQKQTKVASELEKSSGWVGKALGGVAATAGTLLGAGGLYLAAVGTGGAAGAVGGGAVGGGAAFTGSFAVGGYTISSGLVASEVSAAEVDAVLAEILPDVCTDAIGEAAPSLRPVTLPTGPAKIPVLARKRQAGGDTPELKRWRVAAVALLAQQAIKDALAEAVKQAQQDMGTK
ncbi:hypothetical protein A9K55_009125 [Cordyceps militaris]|uniref:Uncharacterized protein n=1 Tax=Cordyceps militaris TaxID=73501 RepID=A0A2H4SJL5_CORMI|nr:hypothetical protein A9K55_009125 [Cordyceps militaris]